MVTEPEQQNNRQDTRYQEGQPGIHFLRVYSCKGCPGIIQPLRQRGIRFHRFRLINRLLILFQRIADALITDFHLVDFFLYCLFNKGIVADILDSTLFHCGKQHISRNNDNQYQQIIKI